MARPALICRASGSQTEVAAAGRHGRPGGRSCGDPEAIAYPVIAGLPPQTGVYSSIFALAGYALLGPSRQLIVGPDAPTLTVLGAALANVSATALDDRVAAAAAVALAVGVLCLFASRLHLGVVAAFLSKPILVGFISGVSISILVGQIGRLTGLRIESEGLVAPVVELFRKAGSIYLCWSSSDWRHSPCSR